MHGWGSNPPIFVVLVGCSIIFYYIQGQFAWENDAIIIEIENVNHNIKVLTTKYDRTWLKFENFSNFIGKHPAKLILSQSFN